MMRLLLYCMLCQMVEQVARVLRPGTGRAVFLLQSAQQLLSSLDCEYFKPFTTESRGVNIGGYVCVAVVAYRSEKVFVEPKKSSEMWERDGGKGAAPCDESSYNNAEDDDRKAPDSEKGDGSQKPQKKKAKIS